MKFLTSRYLLFLALALIAVELTFRLGLYEPVVSPSSHSGTTILLKRALKAFDGDQVKVVTFGDSRAGQGLHNKRIYEAGKAFNVDHLKLSMAGSHLLTFKALASWSLDELEDLEGIVIAVSPAAFAWMGNGAYELDKIMPLRNDIPAREMFKHVPFMQSDIRTFAPLFSAAGYRDDIKDLLANPIERFQALQKRDTRTPMSILAYTSTPSYDICYVSTDDPDACLRALQASGDELPERARHGLETLCKAALKNRKTRKPGPEVGALVDEWVSFMEQLSRRVRVMLVILPDHSVYRDHQYHPNIAVVGQRVVARLNETGIVDVVDLREVIRGQESPECGFFMDHVHLNMAGKQLLTDSLLPELEAFWARLPGVAEPAAY